MWVKYLLIYIYYFTIRAVVSLSVLGVSICLSRSLSLSLTRWLATSPQRDLLLASFMNADDTYYATMTYLLVN